MESGGGRINSSQSEEKKGEKIELSKLELLLLSPRDATPQTGEDSFLEKAKVKSKAKVVSAWNNVKYGTFSPAYHILDKLQNLTVL